MNMKRTWMGVVGLMTLTAVACASSHYAVVDMQKVLTTSHYVTKASEEMKAKYTKRHDALSHRSSQLQQELQNLQKNSKTQSQEETAKLQQDLQKRAGQLAKEKMAFQEEVMHTQEEKMHAIMNRIRAVIASIASDEDYQLVLTKRDAMFVDPHLDITDKVLKNLGN